jgi:hypothetical protein
LIPLPASTHGDYNAIAAITLPTQFNREGEIVAEGCATISGWAFPADGHAHQRGERRQQQEPPRAPDARSTGGGVVRLAHYDGQPDLR